MENLAFSYNWNNKLDCKAFSTIRLYNPAKHFVGQQFAISLKDTAVCTGTVMAVKPFYLPQLTPYMSYLDTGYSVDECAGIIRKMYGKVNFEQQQLAFILIKKDK